ncbi:PfkB family carbohydrate kinase [Diplogelasinospora grovesii]|uniref:PfkB family carbohydrate kinase n=1 Tax=Diplogelasinospora grovesii TaxID=303347 RepID=A0AAN6NFG3_9PEZI|nr:PfkB family carbohydrate kinase [Diplogelasinospora grovesii]
MTVNSEGHQQRMAQNVDAVEVVEDEGEKCQDIDFVTLGMFIIDEIEYLPPKPPALNILGGAGTYSALGARLFSPPPTLSKSVGWIIDQGSDFPGSMTTLIDTWSTSAVFRLDPNRLTTRGWNGYTDASERRQFRYTTPKKRLTAEDLTGCSPLLRAKAIHMVCSPARCRDLVTDINARRRSLPDYPGKPLIIWEPVPDLCTPDELLNCTNTLPLVDICSPNHAELAGFMGSDGLTPDGSEISTAAVEQACEQLLASMPLQSYTLVVRAGEKGCYIAKNGGRKKPPPGQQQQQPKKRKKKEHVRGGLQHDTDMEALFAGLLQDDEGHVAREEIEVDPGIEKWLPAYHTTPKKVVDPTGGGNTFLGGLAVALARGKSIEEACAWGSVAASFAIEQVGVPTLNNNKEGGGEMWNGVRVEDRLAEYLDRVALSSGPFPN